MDPSTCGTAGTAPGRLLELSVSYLISTETSWGVPAGTGEFLGLPREFLQVTQRVEFVEGHSPCPQLLQLQLQLQC